MKNYSYLQLRWAKYGDDSEIKNLILLFTRQAFHGLRFVLSLEYLFFYWINNFIFVTDVEEYYFNDTWKYCINFVEYIMWEVKNNALRF